MFDLGFGELLIIAAVALFLFAPNNLPHAAHQVGEWMATFRSMIEDLRSSFFLNDDQGFNNVSDKSTINREIPANKASQEVKGKDTYPENASISLNNRTKY